LSKGYQKKPNSYVKSFFSQKQIFRDFANFVTKKWFYGKKIFEAQSSAKLGFLLRPFVDNFKKKIVNFYKFGGFTFLKYIRSNQLETIQHFKKCLFIN
jgi:hypothetical protein